MLRKFLLDNAQNTILELIKSWKLSRLNRSMTLQDVANETGLNSPQAVRGKIQQLEDKGYIRYDEEWEYVALSIAIPEIIYLPLLGFAQCWNLNGKEISDMTDIEKIPFSTKLFSFSTASPEELKHYFFIRAEWNSMEPDIKEGSLVLIKEQQEYTFSDNTLIIHNNIPKIKKIQNISDDLCILISRNTDHKPLLVERGSDDLYVIWVVKQVVTSFN